MSEITIMSVALKAMIVFILAIVIPVACTIVAMVWIMVADFWQTNVF